MEVEEIEKLKRLIKEFNIPIKTVVDKGDSFLHGPYTWIQYYDTKEHKKIYSITEYADGEKRYKIEYYGEKILRLPEEFKDYLEALNKVKELWPTEYDAYITSRPFRKVDEEISHAEAIIHHADPPYNYALQKAQRLTGIRDVIMKRFYGGAWLVVRIPITGIVRVSKDLPRWATGWLIGKKGHRAKELGIKVVVE